MLSKELLGYLEQYNFPIIFLGDEKQINPVKEIDSPVFHQNWYAVTLTEIIRQNGGNPIIDLSRNLPEIYVKMAHLNGEGENAVGFLYSNDRKKIIHKLAEANGTDILKYIAWTNAEVDSINFSVRSFIYGNPAYIEEGEVLVLNSQYVINKDNILHNNFELKVDTLKEDVKTFYCDNESFQYKVYIINEEIYAVHEDFIGMHKQNMRRLKSMCINKAMEWRTMYKFEEQFLEFKYNHAITVHKSQGSTYQDAIINIKDIDRNRLLEEKKRLLYTAVTRASRKVILYNV
jgi:exodeoxyribonuclease-5